MIKNLTAMIFLALIFFLVALAIFVNNLSEQLKIHGQINSGFDQQLELNHRLNEEMLKSHASSNENYEIISELVKNSRRNCAALWDSLKQTSADQALIKGTEAYCTDRELKFASIEKFKSANSAIKESIKALPEVVAEFRRDSFYPRIAVVLNEALTYYVNPREDTDSSLTAAIQILDKYDMRGKHEVLSAFLGHVKNISTLTPIRNQIEKEILDTKIEKDLEKLENRYTAHFITSQKTTYFSNMLFLFFTVLLFSFLVIVFRKLQNATEALTDANAMLEKRVEDRTMKLRAALIELQEKQEMIIQSTKMSALGEMAGGIAHEINTPLGTILLQASILKKFVKDMENQKLNNGLDLILKTVERINKIILGLRRFSRDGGASEKTPEKIKNVIEDTLIFCHEKIKNNSVKLTMDVSDIEMVECVPEQISQVILNLLNNSLDAIENVPEKWIKVSTTFDEKSVSVRVSDCGAGIPLIIQEKIMQPFFTTKQIGKGTGMGLSISQGIAQAHGGRLYYNPASITTEFVLELPRYFAKAA